MPRKPICRPPVPIGFFDTRFEESPQVRVFYPACPTQAQHCTRGACQHDSAIQDGGIPYMRTASANGLASWLKMPRFLVHWLTSWQLPCIRNAAPLHPSNYFTTDSDSSKIPAESRSRYPLVVFSHGLGGSLEVYSDWCCRIAAGGYVVVALESEDGSASHAETEDGVVLPYKRPPSTMQYKRRAIEHFRTTFLAHRACELDALLDGLRKHANSHQAGGSTTVSARGSTTGQAPAPPLCVWDFVDVHRVVLSGHSFGAAATAASVIRATRALCSGAVAADAEPTDAEPTVSSVQQKSGGLAKALSSNDIVGVLLLDLWPMPLPLADVTCAAVGASIHPGASSSKHPLPPIVSIIGESFAKSPEVYLTSTLLSHWGALSGQLRPPMSTSGDSAACVTTTAVPLPPKPFGPIKVLHGTSLPSLVHQKGDLEHDCDSDASLCAIKALRAYHLCVPGAVHQSFSDSPLWLPAFIGSRLALVGATPHAVAMDTISAASLTACDLFTRPSQLHRCVADEAVEPPTSPHHAGWLKIIKPDRTVPLLSLVPVRYDLSTCDDE